MAERGRGELDRVCSGCGATVADPAVASCPAARPGDDVDHLLEVPEPPGPWPAAPAPADTGGPPGPGALGVNPFVHYRSLAYSWRVARAAGLEDQAYVELALALDAAVAHVDGHGFGATPLLEVPGLAQGLGLGPGVRLLVKDETVDVSGSHKARHLFGLALHQRVLEALGGPPLGPTPLAIASCGNAALGAAVVAAAGRWHLDVFVPPWASPATLDHLRSLGARVELCERRPGEAGDPCVLRYREAVAAGAVPFTTQGPENGLTLDGGATLGYELADQLAAVGARPERCYVQVGGGALASAVVLGLGRAARLGALPGGMPALMAVQAAGAAPLARAHDRVEELVGRAGGGRGGDRRGALALALDEVARHRSRAMWPWEPEPSSMATGILDDETYDWRRLVGAMLGGSGRPVTVSEDDLAAAHRLARGATGVDADPTATAGLAGVMADARRAGTAPPAGSAVVALLTGATRHPGTRG